MSAEPTQKSKDFVHPKDNESLTDQIWRFLNEMVPTNTQSNSFRISRDKNGPDMLV